MFNIPNSAKYHEAKVVNRSEPLPSIVEGAEVYDTLCPVSKKTGHRENPLTLLAKVLPPDKARLANTILQEIPSIQQENPNISDGDAIDMAVERFSSGTPYEDAQLRESLFNAADVLFPQLSDKQVDQMVTQSIEPSSADASIENV